VSADRKKADKAYLYMYCIGSKFAYRSSVVYN